MIDLRVESLGSQKLKTFHKFFHCNRTMIRRLSVHIQFVHHRINLFFFNIYVAQISRQINLTVERLGDLTPKLSIVIG